MGGMCGFCVWLDFVVFVLWICGECVGDNGKYLMGKRLLNKVVFGCMVWLYGCGVV